MDIEPIALFGFDRQGKGKGKRLGIGAIFLAALLVGMLIGHLDGQRPSWGMREAFVQSVSK